jgi:hypothetical protein
VYTKKEIKLLKNRGMLFPYKTFKAIIEFSQKLNVTYYQIIKDIKRKTNSYIL